MLTVVSLIIFSLMLAYATPTLYERARQSAAQSHRTTDGWENPIRIRSCLAILLLGGGMLSVALVSSNPVFTLFVLLLGSAAYIDGVTQWVPDMLIFALSWVALSAVLPGKDPLPPLVGAAVMLLPALTLNLVTAWRSQPPALAAGDLYVLPAVGAWLTPEWAAACLGGSLVLAAIAGKFARSVPFIPILYSVFMVVSLCGTG
ncbi:A24 family peptidase [Serratia symbiotica]|uniref:A24 family peptidase n=1 Tax=Serratia symbiotica TaxID=138074 RepID=UPI001CF065DF|nr:A24 family peptidase [Serratia symbiotica]